jgi:hypothetical protein
MLWVFYMETKKRQTMFESNSAPTMKLFFPLLFLFVGAKVMLQPGLFWVGILFIFLSVVILFWIVIHDIIRESRLHTREHGDYLLAKARLAETVGTMTSQSKAEIGIIPVPEQTTVKFDRTQQIGGVYNVEYPIFSVTPVELREIAQVCWVQGVPFSVRKLMGTASEPKIRKLETELLKHKLLNYKDPEHTTLGVEWTEDGRKFLQQIAES